nr:hypothetical protein [Tanacetum cinerariifolium]
MCTYILCLTTKIVLLVHASSMPSFVDIEGRIRALVCGQSQLLLLHDPLKGLSKDDLGPQKELYRERREDDLFDRVEGFIADGLPAMRTDTPYGGIQHNTGVINVRSSSAWIGGMELISTFPCKGLSPIRGGTPYGRVQTQVAEQPDGTFWRHRKKSTLITLKLKPQYRFAGDGRWRYSHDVAWTKDEAENTFNILDL